MSRIPDSQLVLHTDGSVYHLRLFPHQIADSIVLVGDPGRVKDVSRFLDHIEFQMSNREIVTHTGTYKGKRITVLSTGMGTDNIDIVVNELDALANIDLKTREIHPEHRKLNLVRLGTSGALQPEIEAGKTYVAAEYALGLDGLLHFYANAESVIERPFTKAFMDHMQWPGNLPEPYIVKGSSTLLEKLGKGYIHGVTATSPGFYGPQGRSLRLSLADKSMNQKIESFTFNNHKISNFEMESSALYGLSRLLGHEALTICLIIANRVTEKFAGNYHEAMDHLILQTLNSLVEP